MDSYQNKQQPNQNLNSNNYYYNKPIREIANSFAVISLLMGIISIVTTILCTVYLPFIFGGLAIIFAILSKGNKKELHSTAVAGLITSIIGLVLNVLLIGFCIIMVLTIPVMREEVNTACEQMYGESFDEIFERSTGISISDYENSENQ